MADVPLSDKLIAGVIEIFPRLLGLFTAVAVMKHADVAWYWDIAGWIVIYFGLVGVSRWLLELALSRYRQYPNSN
jgi:hypothetical protein